MMRLSQGSTTGHFWRENADTEAKSNVIICVCRLLTALDVKATLQKRQRVCTVLSGGPLRV